MRKQDIIAALKLAGDQRNVAQIMRINNRSVVDALENENLNDDSWVLRGKIVATGRAGGRTIYQRGAPVPKYFALVSTIIGTLYVNGTNPYVKGNIVGVQIGVGRIQRRGDFYPRSTGFRVKKILSSDKADDQYFLDMMEILLEL